MEAALSSEERQAVSLSSSPPNESTVTPGATVSIQGVGTPVDLAKLLGKSSTCEALLKMVRKENERERMKENYFSVRNRLDLNQPLLLPIPNLPLHPMVRKEESIHPHQSLSHLRFLP